MYFYLKTPNGNQETLIYIKYYISQKEGRFVYSTNTKILPKDWDSNSKSVRLKRGRDDLAVIRRKIEPFHQLLTSLLSNCSLSNITATRTLLKGGFDKKFNPEKFVKESHKKVKFNDLILDLIKTKKKGNQYAKSTEIKYNNLQNKLVAFQDYDKIKLSYNSFHSRGDFLERWLDYCYNELNHTDNTVGKSVRMIKTILLYARSKGYHSMYELSHLKSFRQETDDIALNKKEFLFYYNYDFKSNKKLDRARDLFCIGCLTGQRYSDYSKFTKADYKNGNIEKRAKKTKFKSIIPVDANPKLKKLFEKYDWQIPIISDQKLREYVKEGLKLTERLEYNIKKVSYQGTKKIERIFKKYEMVGTHTARRTFITLFLEGGGTYKEAMTITGIKSMSTIISYDKVNNERLNKRIEGIFDT